MRPLIGVTTTLSVAGLHGVPNVMLAAQYLDAVENAGGAVVLLSPAHSGGGLDALLARVAGLVLSGGEDLDPALYGRAPHPELEEVNRARDEFELGVARWALERDLPLLGICRGAQLLNVALDGTLVQHLPDLRPGPPHHRQKEGFHQNSHDVRIAEDSLLGKVVRAPRITVNSWHHQGLERLGRGLRATAWAEDGLVEAVERTAGRWCCGVQWHPERCEAASPGPVPPNAALFASLVEASNATA
jgi:putative glutamine amidotransferase